MSFLNFYFVETILIERNHKKALAILGGGKSAWAGGIIQQMKEEKF